MAPKLIRGVAMFFAAVRAFRLDSLEHNDSNVEADAHGEDEGDEDSGEWENRDHDDEAEQGDMEEEDTEEEEQEDHMGVDVTNGRKTSMLEDEFCPGRGSRGWQMARCNFNSSDACVNHPKYASIHKRNATTSARFQADCTGEQEQDKGELTSWCEVVSERRRRRGHRRRTGCGGLGYKCTVGPAGFHLLPLGLFHRFRDVQGAMFRLKEGSSDYCTKEILWCQSTRTKWWEWWSGGKKYPCCRSSVSSKMAEQKGSFKKEKCGDNPVDADKGKVCSNGLKECSSWF